MKTLTPKAIQARQFIYALDPNRHLLADIPFPDYLLHLVKVSARPAGLPVPESAILTACAVCRGDDFWKEVAEEILACVQEIGPTSPSEIPEDPEEVWRRGIFTYPPGRYAVLKCGEELAGLAAANTAKSSALVRFAKRSPASRNRWDRAVARAVVDSKASHDNASMGLKVWIRREEIRAERKSQSALQIALAAARLAPKPVTVKKS